MQFAGFVQLLAGKNHSVAAVSYTHLDVYKRQVQQVVHSRAELAGRAGGEGVDADIAAGVANHLARCV